MAIIWWFTCVVLGTFCKDFLSCIFAHLPSSYCFFIPSWSSVAVTLPQCTVSVACVVFWLSFRLQDTLPCVGASLYRPNKMFCPSHCHPSSSSAHYLSAFLARETQPSQKHHTTTATIEVKTVWLIMNTCFLGFVEL